MLDLLDKDFEWTILNKVKELKETTSKELKEMMTILSHLIVNVIKELV